MAEEDLHIYLIDSKNPKLSIKNLEETMKKRTRRNNEVWLIEISALKTIENAKPMLNNLMLDIDDAIYTFKFANESLIDIWEIYKLLPETDLIVKKFGTWYRGYGLSLTKLSIWQRRKDLTVSSRR